MKTAVVEENRPLEERKQPQNNETFQEKVQGKGKFGIII